MNTKLSKTWLLNWDCQDILPKIPTWSIDLILTDPPYLARYTDRSWRSIQNDIKSNWLKPAFINLYRVLKDDSFCISFYGWHQVEKFMIAWKTAWFKPVWHLVFQKKYSSKTWFLAGTHECAYLLAKWNPKKPVNPISDVQGWEYTGNKLHPTQKPVWIMQPLIKQFSKENQTVLDSFCGSWTVWIACKSLNRKFIWIEIDKYYYEKAYERLKKYGCL